MSRSTSPVRRHTTSLVTLLALVAGLLAFAPPASSARDANCSDFASQRAAQYFFLRQGGPQRDPHNLDSDGDGIACESNPAPYYYGRTLPGKPKPQPKPKPKPVVVRTTATLAIDQARRIAGEQVVFRSQVSPAHRTRVVLQRKVGRAWKQVVAGQTTRNGAFATSVRAPKVASRYRLVAAAKKVGRKQFTADQSPVRKVTILRQRMRFSMPASGITGDEVNARVVALPGRNLRPVRIQQRVGAGWVLVGYARTAGAAATVPVELPGTAGTYQYRAVVGRHKGAPAFVSGIKLVTVEEPEDTTPPAVPANLALVGGDTQVAVEWDPVSDADLSHYVLQWSTTNGDPWTTVTPTSPTSTSETVTGLTNDTEYWFRVRAVDTSGNASAFTIAENVTPAAPPMG